MYCEGDEDSDTFSSVKIRIKPCNPAFPFCLYYYTVGTGPERWAKYSTAVSKAFHGDTTTFEATQTI
jgi:hypothetical protein